MRPNMRLTFQADAERMKKFVIVLLMALSVGQCLATEAVSLHYPGMPHLKKNESYVSVRQKMLKAGWTPYHAQDALECAPTDDRCAGRPEMEACSDVGEGQCAWLWQKNEVVVVVDTIYGADNDVFVGVSRYQKH
ncbi:hypothetical protein [Paraburkholderia dipogonis]|uniref:hypothetical protein n=1 Tax=Paraburkholderia dipogonis TaxID=1211383 RepID=UPI0038BB96BA